MGKIPRILCLHGFRTSAYFLELHLKQWPAFILERMDLVFINAPFPSGSQFGFPSYEWFQANEGGALAASLPGMQREGVALCKVPKIKFVIIIGGIKFGGSLFRGAPSLAKNAFSSPVNTPSLHIIGEKDNNWKYQFELVDAFVNPMLLYHHEGHVVPHLDENGVKIVVEFLDEIQGILEVEEARKSSSSCCRLLTPLICMQRKWWNRNQKVQSSELD